MDRIIQSDNIFFLDDGSGGILKPIPPYFSLTQECELKIRLKSTAGGNAAKWDIAREEARNCLNESPYQPMYRGIVKDFEWAPPNTWDCPSHLYSKDVNQSGLLVNNFTFNYVKPIEDPVKTRISELSASPRELIWKQGSLKISRLDLVEILDFELAQGSGNRWFFNHVFIGHQGFVYRVIDQIAIAIVQFDESGWILSPDHPEEPYRVITRSYTGSCTGACLIAKHPIPSSKVD